MKSMAMLVAAAGIALAATASSALSQQVCSKSYLGCMNECTTRPRTVQDRCLSACQRENDRCSNEIYGGRKESDPAQQATDGKPAKRSSAPHHHKTAATPSKIDPATSKAHGAAGPGDFPPPVWNEPEPLPSGEKHSNP